jgi:GntR family transcriptional regulator
MAFKITRGDWPPDYQLPAELELAAKLGVSRGSLRKAIRLLASSHLLLQVHGKGTFVRPAVIEQRWAGQLVGTSEELLTMGISFATVVLEQRAIPCPARVRRILQLQAGEQVVYLKRLRSVGGVPVVMHENHLPAARYADLLQVNFAQERLLATLEQRCGLRLTRAEHVIAAVSADGATARLLGLELGDPVLYNEHVAYDQDDRIVECGSSWFRGDRVRLRTQVTRGVADDVYSIDIPVQQAGA